MEGHNIQRSGLVNLAAGLVIAMAALVVTSYVNSLAGLACSFFLGLGMLVAFAGWFQIRLENNEQLEKLELEELARTRREATLFGGKAQELFPAQRVRAQFEKYFVPALAVLLFGLEAAAAAWLWRWTARSTAVLVPERAMESLSLFGMLALLLFLLGRFSVTMARLENHRLLRPGASFLLAGAYVCVVTTLAIAGVRAGFPLADFYLARALCVLLGLMSAEMLITLLLEVYRPRLKGKVARPLYESRIVGLLAQPEGLFTAAAQALDYQFGFKVSETWIFLLLRQSLPVLLLAQLAALLLSTCFIFIDPGEQGVRERFGRLADRPVLEPGAHWLWPWPIDQVHRYRTGQIQTFNVGFTPNEQSRADSTVLWTVTHNAEVNFLVGNRAPATVTNLNAAAGDRLKVAPVGLIDISIPVQFQITNVLAWAYTNADQTNLLADLATREVVRYLAGADINEVLSASRDVAARQLRENIQDEVNRHQLGVKILFAGVQDLHPPVKVAGDYEKVVSAEQERVATNNFSQADAIRTNALAGAEAFASVNRAQAVRQETVLSAFAHAALFTNQLAAYAAAPSVFRQRAYFHMFPAATANARKYILLATNTHNVLVFNLEDRISADLLNLNVPTNSP